MSSATHRYYIKGEHYDWTRDPRAIEKMFHTLRSRIFSSLHDSNHPILDIGCGTGLVANTIPTVVGIDINRWNLLRCRRFPRIQASAEFLPIRTGSFTEIICSEVLEHLDSPDRVLRETLRILQPGGRLMGTTPAKSILWRLRRYLSVTHPHSEPFHRNFPRKELAKLLEPFANVKIRYANLGMIHVFTADN